MSKEAGNEGLSESEVDALIATHAADDDAHHAKYTDGEADARAAALIVIHASDDDAHHTKYTDAEADARAAALIATHAAIAGAHHTKYTDAEADARAAALIATHASDADAHHEALPTNHKAKAHPNANQSIPSGAVTTLTFDVEDYDPGSHFASNRYTVAKAGVYLIVLGLYMISISDTKTAAGIIYKNTTVIAQHGSRVGGTGDVQLIATAMLDLAVDDYIEGKALHNVGANRDASAAKTFLSVHLISA